MRDKSKLSWDKTYLNIAKEFGTHSTCVRLNVGAVIVKDNHIIGAGYNGSPSGMVQCNEVFTPDKISKPDFMEAHHCFALKNEIHAEQNAIAYAARTDSTPLEGATMYITLSPCNACARLIISAGIKRVVYSHEYDRENAGKDLLKEVGVSVEYIGEDN